MAVLLARCDEDGLLQPEPELLVGDSVCIVAGPFADTVTRIEALNRDGRIAVLIDLMGQQVRLTLPSAAVRRTGPWST